MCRVRVQKGGRLSPRGRGDWTEVPSSPGGWGRSSAALTGNLKEHKGHLGDPAGGGDLPNGPGSKSVNSREKMGETSLPGSFPDAVGREGCFQLGNQHEEGA